MWFNVHCVVQVDLSLCSKLRFQWRRWLKYKLKKSFKYLRMFWMLQSAKMLIHATIRLIWYTLKFLYQYHLLDCLKVIIKVMFGQSQRLSVSLFRGHWGRENEGNRHLNLVNTVFMNRINLSPNFRWSKKKNFTVPLSKQHQHHFLYFGMYQEMWKQSKDHI